MIFGSIDAFGTFVCWGTVRSEQRGEDRLSEAECLRAWMRDLSGCCGSEAFKTKAGPGRAWTVYEGSRR